MRRLFCAIAGILVMVGTYAQPPETTSDPVELSVRVRGLKAELVEGAEVFVYYSRGLLGAGDRLVATLRTDANGEAELAEGFMWEASLSPKPRQYQNPRVPTVPQRLFVVAYVKGMALGAEKIMPSLKTEEDVQIKMEPLVPRKIQVRDHNRKPMNRAHVYLRSVGPTIFYSEQSFCKGLTDDSGVATLSAPEKATFFAEKEGSCGEIVRENEVTLYPSAELRGTVRHEDGTPAAHALIWIQQVARKNVNSFWRTWAMADEQGRYCFPGAPASHVPGQGSTSGVRSHRPIIVNGHSGQPASPLQTGMLKVTLEPREKMNLGLVLKRPPKVSGKVLAVDTHRPVEGLRLGITFETPSRGGVGTEVVTDAKGRFEAEVPPDGFVRMMALGSDNDEVILDMEWRNAEPCLFRERISKDVSGLKFYVKVFRTKTIRGRVLDSTGEPLAKARVYGPGDRAYTDADGRFTMKGSMKSTSWELFVKGPAKDVPDATGGASQPGAHPHGVFETGHGIFEAGDQRVEITTTHSLRCEGVVVDTTGAPAPNLQFQVFPITNKKDLRALEEIVTTDKDGRFVLHGLCPMARYSANFHDNEEEGCAENRFAFEPGALGADAPLKFTVRRFNKQIRGKVVDTAGNPVPGAKVEVLSWRTRDPRAEFSEYETDEQGSFLVPRVAAGISTLCAEAEGFNRRVFLADPKDPPVTVVLNSGLQFANYRIRYVDEDGKPLRGLTVIARYSADGKTSYGAAAVTDLSGIIAFPWSASGNGLNHILLSCQEEGYRHAYTAVRPHEDVDSQIVIRSSGPVWNVTVVDSEKQPIPGATLNVAIYDQSGCGEASLDMLGELGPRFTTDREGKATLSTLSRHDSLGLAVSAPGYMDGWADLSAKDEVGAYIQPQGNTLAVSIDRLDEDPEGRAVITLKKQARIVGQVLFVDTKEPVPNFRMRAKAVAHKKISFITDEKGRFELNSLAPNTYTIVDEHFDNEGRLLPYILTSPEDVEVKEDEEVKLTLYAAKRVVVEGRVVDAATGNAPDQPVLVLFDDGSERCYGEHCRKDGSWKIEVYPGTFKVQLSDRPGRANYKTIESFEVREGKQEELFIKADFPSAKP